MQKRPTLQVEKRTVLGKKIKKLRREGILPANIYGKELASVAIQMQYKDFDAVYKEIGETGLVDIMVDGENRPALIKNLQLESVSRTPLHVDFYQVNMKEKVKTMVPIEIVGEPKAVTEEVGLMLTPTTEIEVEALPADLPEKFEVSVEHLAVVGDQMTVADLKIPQGVEVLTDPGQVIVKIDELISKEALEQAAADAAAAEAAKAESAGGAEAAEGAEGKPEGAETEAGESAEGAEGKPKGEEKSEVEQKSEEKKEDK